MNLLSFPDLYSTRGLSPGFYQPPPESPPEVVLLDEGGFDQRVVRLRGGGGFAAHEPQVELPFPGVSSDGEGDQPHQDAGHASQAQQYLCGVPGRGHRALLCGTGHGGPGDDAAGGRSGVEEECSQQGGGAYASPVTQKVCVQPFGVNRSCNREHDAQQQRANQETGHGTNLFPTSSSEANVR